MFKRTEIQTRGIMIKLIFHLLCGMIIVGHLTAEAGTCSSISRTNFSANSVLTSSVLNTQFNDVYNAANDLDGGCITDGSLELDATDSSWDALKNYLQAGCKVSYSNASTLSISKCYLAVNGSFVSKSTATSVSFGCTNCSSESASTTYYLYAADGSSGSTLTPLILTTAPNDDGYDASNNRVLAKFYNNATSDIVEHSIDNWKVSSFVPTNTEWSTYTPTLTSFGTISESTFLYRRVGDDIEVKGFFKAGTTVATVAKITLPAGFEIDDSKIIDDRKTNLGTFHVGTTSTQDIASVTNNNGVIHPDTTSSTSEVFFASDTTATSSTVLFNQDNANAFAGSGAYVSLEFTVPVKGLTVN